MKDTTCQGIIDFIRGLYPQHESVPLHAPSFLGNEKKYLCECIDTTYVSYVGHFVSDFEEHIKRLTGARHAIAMVNGTAAILMALVSAGVRHGDEVITQALTFAATAAGIRHAGADPVFVDVDRETMSMSPESLLKYLQKNAQSDGNDVLDRLTGKRIIAIMPMHTFGHPARLDELLEVCREFNIMLIEDAAESIGSYYKGRHTGRFGKAAILSFNGNKPVTTGGGGMLLTDDEAMAERARHLSTTAKLKHRWEFVHDEVGYNLRMPNVNAAIGCAQMESIEQILNDKRNTAMLYKEFFSTNGLTFFWEPRNCKSNYWLNAIILDSREERDAFLEYSNDRGVQTRPIWTLMNKLAPYANYPHSELPNAEWLEERVVNIPSSVRY